MSSLGTEWGIARRVLGREVLRPIATLNARTAPAGGALAKTVKEKANGLRGISGLRSITLLVHGYNVNKRWADVAYSKFAMGQAADQLRDLVWVYWPGDATKSKWTSWAGYPFMLSRAQDSAALLANHLISRGKARGRVAPIELRIFAHSLGCRVTLELIKKLMNSKTFKMTELVLMAAAVRIFHVMPNAREEEDLRKALLWPDRAHIYHSYRDLVLAGAFRPGQWFDPPKSHTTRATRAALGRCGLDPKHHKPGHTVQQEMKHRHGHYWSAPNVAQKARGILPSLTRKVNQRKKADGRTVLLRRVDPFGS